MSAHENDVNDNKESTLTIVYTLSFIYKKKSLNPHAYPKMFKLFVSLYWVED